MDAHVLSERWRPAPPPPAAVYVPGLLFRFALPSLAPRKVTVSCEKRRTGNERQRAERKCTRGHRWPTARPANESASLWRQRPPLLQWDAFFPPSSAGLLGLRQEEKKKKKRKILSGVKKLESGCWESGSARGLLMFTLCPAEKV